MEIQRCRKCGLSEADVYTDGTPVRFYVRRGARNATGLYRPPRCRRCEELDRLARVAAKRAAGTYPPPRSRVRIPPPGYVGVAEFARRQDVCESRIYDIIDRYETIIRNGITYIKVED